MTTILIVGGCLIGILLVVGLVVSITSERRAANQRIEQIVSAGHEVPSEDQRRSPLTEWLNQRVQSSSYGGKISRDLARADLKIKPAEYVLIIAASVVLVAVIGYFLTGKTVFGAIGGGVLGLFIPGFYVRSQQSKRLVHFNDQLPDMLNLMVNGLRAGYSNMQAMESVSKELPPPICDEFRRVVQEMQLGVSMEKALENLLRRIPSDDLDLVITAINVQREVGGNLADILDTISHTIRERIRIKGEIRVLTTQTLYSGRMLALMPIFVILILYLLNPDYMQEYMRNGWCGYVPLICSGILIISGYFAMTKIAQVEV